MDENRSIKLRQLSYCRSFEERKKDREKKKIKVIARNRNNDRVCETSSVQFLKHWPGNNKQKKVSALKNVNLLLRWSK